MRTWHIHINGRVQGVGFRPHVYQLAHQYGVHGNIENTVDGVHIYINALKKTVDKFVTTLVANPPKLAFIVGYTIKETAFIPFDTFSIITGSASSSSPQLHITPDVAMCTDCRSELTAQQDRRFQYPYITCTNCGPRYSIMTALPYDRKNTTMDVFEMCPTCKKEYHNPLDRRHYSQTNSCPDCAITLESKNNSTDPDNLINESVIETILNFWRNGLIVAIKSIGGYLLTCDASNRTVIETLRKRKHRPSKPFALMAPDVAWIDTNTIVSAAQHQELQGSSAPIVLLQSRIGTEITDTLDTIAPETDRVGIMLPYSPLFYLLLERFERPIVATSGNVSNAPIAYDTATASNQLASVADLIVHDNRALAVPQDDSVVAYSQKHHQRILLRRSRGLAPCLYNSRLPKYPDTLLATGAMLKSTFGLYHNEVTYLSQYLGNLDHYDTQLHFKTVLEHLTATLKAKPSVILCDRHPDYPSSAMARELSTRQDASLFEVQHHKAHFAAVLGEHDLIDTDTPVLGIIWDGTGLGDDMAIWGGEFFKYEHYQFTRIAHLDYFALPYGDKVAKEPRLSALLICQNCDGSDNVLRSKFSETEWRIYQKGLKATSVQCSSMGRLFDAVASLIGLCDIQTFEGEAAMRLEACARRFIRDNPIEECDAYPISTENGIMDMSMLMAQIVSDVLQGVNASQIAIQFHLTLINMIKLVADKAAIDRLAFSGGCFQNSLLVDLIIDALGDSHTLYFHKELSPNDENVAFGQLMHYAIARNQSNNVSTQTQNHVLSNTW